MQFQVAMHGNGQPSRPSSVDSVQSSHSSASSVSASGRKLTAATDFGVGEEVRIAVNIAFERFRLSEEQKGQCCSFNTCAVGISRASGEDVSLQSLSFHHL